MRTQTAKIREAREASERASRSFKETNEELTKTAVAAGHIPEKFKQAGDIAQDIVRDSYTATLFKASGLSPKSTEKLAKKAGKEAGKQEKQHRIKEDFGPALKDFGKEESEAAPPPAAPTPTPAPSGGGGGGAH